MGAESGSQQVLDAMEKGIKVEDVYRGAREPSRGTAFGPVSFCSLVIRAKGWNEIEATIRMVRDVQPDDIGVSVSYPLPGTRFFQLVSQQLGRKANWSESGDLSMMFQGAFSSDFYRALADALHLEVHPKGKRRCASRRLGASGYDQRPARCWRKEPADEAPFDPRVFSRGRCQGTANYEALRSSGHSLPLFASAQSRGFDVDIYDSTFGSKAELCRILQEESPGILGIYANLMTRTQRGRDHRHARAAGWHVVLGGPEPSNYPEQYLDCGSGDCHRWRRRDSA